MSEPTNAREPSEDEMRAHAESPVEGSEQQSPREPDQPRQHTEDPSEG